MHAHAKTLGVIRNRLIATRAASAGRVLARPLAAELTELALQLHKDVESTLRARPPSSGEGKLLCQLQTYPSGALRVPLSEAICVGVQMQRRNVAPSPTNHFCFVWHLPLCFSTLDFCLLAVRRRAARRYDNDDDTLPAAHRVIMRAARLRR